MGIFNHHFLFTHAMTYGMVRIRMMEELKADHAKQNAQINLLLAENERHRLGAICMIV